MATVVKDFKIKSGLIVEGSSATVNNYAVLTKSPSDQSYITTLVGGASTSTNTANSIVLRDANGDFAAGTITAETGFSGDLTGDVTGNVTGNLTGNVTGTVSDISNHDTDDLGEGINNLYFTDARAQDALAGMYDPAGSASAAQTAAESYADGVALTAENNANSYTDGEILSLDSSLKLYADSAATTAETNAKSYADSLAVNYDAAGSASTAESNAASYTDTAIANLIDGAPDLLNTLNEIAAAIADDSNFSTTVLSDIAQGLTDAKAYTDTRETAITTAYQSYADTAEADAVTAANSYTDTAISGVNTTIGALDTDDIAEGVGNLYFTDERAQDAVGAMLTGTQTNITVTYDDAAGTLSFVAENGVADSTTDDLTEGSTNLYFTDARAQAAVAGDIVSAIDALDTDAIEEGVNNLYFTDARAQSAVATDIADAVAAGDATATPTYAAVDINSVSKQVAATQTVASASQVVALSWAIADYTSAELVVKVTDGTHSELSKVLVTMDSSNNIAITEYGVVGTNGSLSTITAGVNGTDVEVLVTTANNNSDVTVAGTLVI